MKLDRKSKSVVYSCYVAYFLSGFVILSFGAIMPILIVEKGLSYTLAGGLLTSMAIGNLLASFIYPPLSAKFGEKTVTVAITFCYPICLFGFTLTSSVWLLYLLIALIGLTRGIITLTNNRTVNTITGNSPKHQNILHTTFAVGAFSAPFMIDLLSKVGIGWETILRGLAILTAFIPFFYSRIDKEAIKGTGATTLKAEEKEPSRNEGNRLTTQSKSLFTFAGYWLALGIIFCYLGLENTVNGWFKTYLQDAGIMSTTMASVMVSVTWLMIMVGRLIIAFISDKVKTSYILCTISTLQLIALILLLTAKTGGAVIVALVLFGLGLAGIYPTLMAYVGVIINNTNMGMSILTGIGSVGGILTPQLIGVLADKWGLNIAILLMAVSSVILFILGALTVPESKRRLK